MTSLEDVLLDDPWVPYNDSFFHSRLVLTYPKNKIFTTQLLHRVLSLPVYQTYPSAQVFDVLSLNSVDWKDSVIALDHDFRVVMAPEPVLALIQLDRRLHYTVAEQNIFGPFRLLPLQWFRHQWIGIAVIVAGWLATTFLLNVIRHKPYRLEVSSKI